MNTNCTVLRDPVAQTLLAELRDDGTKSGRARQLVRDLSGSLMQRVIADTFPTTKTEGVTPLKALGEEDAVFTATTVARNTQVVVCNLLRGGDVPSNTCSKVLDDFTDDHQLHFLGIGRTVDADHHVTGAKADYRKIASIDGKILIFPDCMGATGSTIRQALTEYKNDGHGEPSMILSLNLIISPMFQDRVLSLHPKMRIYTYSVDRRLTNQQYIVPGAGDLGKRLTGVE